MIFVLLIGANASTMKVFAASFIVTFSSNTAVSPTMTSLLPVRAITGKSPEGCEHIDVDAHFYKKKFLSMMMANITALFGQEKFIL